MRTRKKPHGIKHKVCQERKRKERIALAVAASIIMILISSFVTNSMLNQPSTSQTVNFTSGPKAAIVDQLDLTCPNRIFIDATTNTLKQAGYTVDYYPSENVTVELYRNLPTHNYGIIILRVHSVTHNPQMPYTGLFSSESYTKTKYIYEQLTDQVQKVQYHDGESTYFAISSKFVQQSMSGKFQNSIIIMMGCDGLAYTDMAKAFVEKGAKVYISWSGAVSASYTDESITHLLQHFFTEKHPLKESVLETFKEVGADPVYSSLLIYYPLESGSYTLQSVWNNLGVNRHNEPT